MVRQSISHAGYVLPSNLRLPLKEGGLIRSDRFPDFDQSKSDSVEHEVVVQQTAPYRRERWLSPYFASTRAPAEEDPTAVQTVAEVQDTPVNLLSI